MVFPLPLTPFEEYMVTDDRVTYPMTGIFRLRFSGQVDRAAMERAVEQAGSRHPLLRARVQKRLLRAPVWKEAGLWQPLVEWQPACNQYGYPRATPLDLKAGPGTRIWCLEREGECELVAQMHHACTDALGMCQFIEDLLVGYAGNVDGVSEPEAHLRSLSDARLRQRGGLTLWDKLQLAWAQLLWLRHTKEFLKRSPAPLSRATARLADVPLPENYPAPRTYEFAAEETALIIERAKRAKVTVNDLLARDLFLAVAAWREQNGVGNADDWLRFNVPINFREGADEQLSAANKIGMVFLDRRACDMGDRERLLQGLHEETQYIKTHRIGFYFNWWLGFFRRLPGQLARMTSGERCWCTCIFSNLGVLFRKTPLPRREGRIVAGNLVLEGADFVTPLRPYTAAAICVYTYAGRLFVMQHHDPRSLSDAEANGFLDTYLQVVRSSLDHSERPATAPMIQAI